MKKPSDNATHLILDAMRWCNVDNQFSFNKSLAVARRIYQRELREAALKEQP